MAAGSGVIAPAAGPRDALAAVRIECERCGQLVSVERFRSSESGIEVGCPACEEHFFVPSEPHGAPDAGPSGARRSAEIVWREVGATARAAGAMRCPKCDDEQPRAPACRRCGLAAGHFESFRDSGGYELPEAAAESWRRCVERWDDATAHEEFADRVAAAGAFAAAARAYRERLRGEPDDPVARAQLDRLRRMAEAAAFAAAPSSRRAERGREPYRAVVWLLVFFALLAMGGAFYGVLTGDGGSRAPEPIDGPLRLEGGRGAR